MGKYSMQRIITQNFPFYTFVDVDLKGGDTEIADDLDGLIITQPGKDLTEKELRRIDQFVMKGKSLAVIASAVNVKANDATMNATLNLHGLDKLLDGYGVAIEQGRRARHRGGTCGSCVPTAGGIAQAELPQILEVQDDPRFTGNGAAHRHELPGALPHPGRRGAVRVEPVAQDRQAAGREDVDRHALLARRRST